MTRVEVCWSLKPLIEQLSSLSAISEQKAADAVLRVLDSSFCPDCPDHEACSTGWPCWKVKEGEPI